MKLFFPPGVPIIKRLLDLLLVTPGLVLISPILAIIALAVLIADGPPILFCQERPGYRGRILKLCKFRSMRAAVDRRDRPIPDEQRIYPLGRFLRATSLDELPELLQVLAGKMSLVGPRPLLVQYLERYSPEQMRRHDVLPGISGWAQINGRNTVSWEERFQLDVWYVDHWSLWLDIKILALTLWKVVRREGINPADQAIMPEFRGKQ
jgi:sugar transferase EpsL